MKEKVIFSWSGGKDSAFALHELRKTGKYEIVALLTTLSEGYNRTSMHGVREELLDKQACSLGLSLEKVFIKKDVMSAEYEKMMEKTLLKYLSRGIKSVVFGDIFLQDLREYREKNLAKIGMRGIYPIWKKNTVELAQAFIDLGFKAVVTCIDSKILDQKFAGRNFDKSFLSDLESNVNPCGENGEFHSFVYEGPIFKDSIVHKKGEVVLREDRFYFCDLIPI